MKSTTGNEQFSSKCKGLIFFRQLNLANTIILKYLLEIWPMIFLKLPNMNSVMIHHLNLENLWKV